MGLFTAQYIPENTLIDFYCGQLKEPEKDGCKMTELWRKVKGLTYSFTATAEFEIDSFYCGSLARYANHAEGYM